MLRSSFHPTRYIREIQDPFSKELVRLWNGRKLRGRIFTLIDLETDKAEGYCMLEDKADVQVIRGLFIVDEYRGMGHGTNLLGFVCDLCDSEEKSAIIVNISEGAENLYAKFGFNLLGRRKDFPDQIVAYRGELSEEYLTELKSKII